MLKICIGTAVAVTLFWWRYSDIIGLIILIGGQPGAVSDTQDDKKPANSSLIANVVDPQAKNGEIRNFMLFSLPLCLLFFGFS